MKRLALAALLLVASGARAQNPFALVGPGQDVAQGSARVAARGGWGMAEADTLSPTFVNPAALGDLHHLALLFGGYAESSEAAGHGVARRSNRTFLPEVRLALPLRDGRLTLHAGFSTRRSLQYRTQVDTTWSQPDGTGIAGYERLIREGSFFRVPLGLGWRASSWLALGAEVDLVRGVAREELAQVTADPEFSGEPNSRIEERVFSGVTGTFAVLLQPLTPLSLGASYSLAHDADQDRTLSLGGVGGWVESRSTVHLPDEARAGLQLDLGESWQVGGDAKLARWSRFTGIPEWEEAVRDEWTVAFGVERKLRFQPMGRGHVSPWRAGYTWRRGGYEVNGAPVDERIWSVGTGFPLARRQGTIDVGLSYFTLGNEADNGWRTRGWRLALSVTGLERLIF